MKVFEVEKSLQSSLIFLPRHGLPRLSSLNDAAKNSLAKLLYTYHILNLQEQLLAPDRRYGTIFELEIGPPSAPNHLFRDEEWHTLSVKPSAGAHLHSDLQLSCTASFHSSTGDRIPHCTPQPYSSYYLSDCAQPFETLSADPCGTVVSVRSLGWSWFVCTGGRRIARTTSCPTYQRNALSA